MLATSKGLGAVESLAPGRGWVEATAALSRLSGANLDATAGVRLTPSQSLFAVGHADALDQRLGIGWRLDF